MICLPSQHSKSHLTSRLLPPIILSQNPRTSLMLLSYSASLATEHAGFARDYTREVFPHLLGGSQASDNWHTTHGGFLLSAGLYGSVTGRSANGIIIDDIHKGPEDSSSPVMREKSWAAYTAVAETRLAPDGWVCLVGTRFHQDDLQGRLLENEGDEWTVLRFPAFALEDDILGREYGQTLWPQHYKDDWYHERKRLWEGRSQGYMFEAIYQCNPVSNSALCAFSDPSYFLDHIWSEGVEPKSTQLRVLALDPSKSKSGRIGDYNSFADVTLDDRNHIHCRMHLDRQPLTQTYIQAEAIIRAAEQQGNPFKAMMVETNLFQEAIFLHLAEKFATLFPYLLMVPHHTGSTQSKATRIKIGLEPMLAQHRLHFVGRTVANKIALEQTKQVPNGTHDDAPDSIELACQLLNRLLFGQNTNQPKLVLRA